jgi:glycosyltransferase involved in cell wall biosynthesis
MNATVTTLHISQFNKISYLPTLLNTEIKNSDSDFILIIDDLNNEINLKTSCLDIMLMAMERNPNSGMIYADYELNNNCKIEEIHLLKHHIGRVRDDQDYGKVFLIRKSVFEEFSGFDETLKYNYLYDSRLKISEHSEIIHISNKVNGSLYQVKSDKKDANIFDYLLSDEQIQKEAEQVLTEHLKRIGAFLSPNQKFKKRPKFFPSLQQIKTPRRASIIIPVNNRPDFICDAIESGQNQTVKNIEIIVVVNGGKTDPTNDAVTKYIKGGEKYSKQKPKVRLITTDINNLGFCLNLGVNNANGEYYIQLDSDDRLKPTAVEKIIEIFQSDDKIGIAIGSYEVWQKHDSGKLIRDENIPVVTHSEWTEENGRNNLLRVNGAGAPRAIPIQIIKNIGYFEMNENHFARNYGEDYDMVLRISEQYKIGRIYEPIYEVIRHSGGTDHSIDQDTIDRNDEAKDWMRKESILRRQKFNERLNG